MTLREYLQGLSKVVSSLVGNKLSIAKGSNPIPSVFIARQKPPKPLYPYAITDYIGKGNYGDRELYSSFNEDNTSFDSYFNRRLRLRVAFYGKYEDSVLDTADELASRLRTAKGRELLALYMPDSGLMEVSEPTYNDNLITTDYEEFSSIEIDFWIISKISDEQFYSIDSAEINGELYEDYEQQKPPLTTITEFQRN